MSQSPNTTQRKWQFASGRLLPFLAGLVLAFGVAFFFTGAARPQGQVISPAELRLINFLNACGIDIQPVQRITAAELEQNYGLRVTLIGVTAGGGMVDFRFKVLDAVKAKALLDHHDNMPQLIPAGSWTRLGIPSAHSPNYISGKVYYMLYGNAGGVVQPGKPVEVAFGNIILDAITAQ